MRQPLLATIIIITVSLFLSCRTYAQITIKEDNILEKTLIKPKAFDSLSNFTQQKDLISYKQYIGYKLYLAPRSKKYRSQYKSADTLINYLFTRNEVVLTKTGKIPFEDITNNAIYKNAGTKSAHLEQYKKAKKAYDESIDKVTTAIYNPFFVYENVEKSNGKITGYIGTLPKTVTGKYFTILDIRAKQYGEKEYTKLELFADLDWKASLNVTLKNDETNDTIYWNIPQARNIADYPFMLVPYFSKQKALYESKKLVAMRNFSTPLTDVNTGEAVAIKTGDVFTCTDISFTDSEKYKHLTPYYFLKNAKGNEVAFILGSFDNESFITETEFLRREAEKKKLEEQRKKEQAAQEKKAAEELLAFKNECIKKFGAKMGGLISNGSVAIGMSKEMCTYAWGNPISVNAMTSRNKHTEQWIYGWSTYLYFDNGVLTTIQN